MSDCPHRDALISLGAEAETRLKEKDLQARNNPDNMVMQATFSSAGLYHCLIAIALAEADSLPTNNPTPDNA